MSKYTIAFNVAIVYLVAVGFYLPGMTKGELLGDCYSVKDCDIKKLSGHGVHGDYSNGTHVLFNQTDCYSFRTYVGTPTDQQKIKVCSRVNEGECVGCTAPMADNSCYTATSIWVGLCVG
ncbi:hypothetical protein BDZ90DRAFT_281057 [Jaminaea rosea]|uniref:Uncharacterized protein n=1 Tax=Jaminaea rosea TaxID=1569628 RepID=A0A316UP18_9BASI|nr:hypothetical protein BDZ90DRAFT_281057 [Jaminaea rosea]PWN26091.1 hypothetical protein BDZ90DRAFT_281057 [Jaminaea rosea]